MSHKNIANIEVSRRPYPPGCQRVIKNENEMAHGPDNQSVTPKVFAFYFFINIIYIFNN